MAYNKLSIQEKHIILEQGTEIPFSGEYDKHTEKGIYTCKQCNNALFKSETKFDSGTGWPSFDDSIEGGIKEIFDGSRKEVLCAHCNGHLGHVFRGEGQTVKSTRYCINSLSLNFVEV